MAKPPARPLGSRSLGLGTETGATGEPCWADGLVLLPPPPSPRPPGAAGPRGGQEQAPQRDGDRPGPLSFPPACLEEAASVPGQGCILLGLQPQPLPAQTPLPLLPGLRPPSRSRGDSLFRPLEPSLRCHSGSGLRDRHDLLEESSPIPRVCQALNPGAHPQHSSPCVMPTELPGARAQQCPCSHRAWPRPGIEQVLSEQKGEYSLLVPGTGTHAC